MSDKGVGREQYSSCTFASKLYGITAANGYFLFTYTIWCVILSEKFMNGDDDPVDISTGRVKCIGGQ